jgi:hypothetical protein
MPETVASADVPTEIVTPLSRPVCSYIVFDTTGFIVDTDMRAT